MSAVKWIKLSTDIFDDETIKLVEDMPEGDTIIVIWLKLLVQAGKINNNGFVYFKKGIPYTEEMLATVFRRPLNIIRLALQVFKQFGMVEVCDIQGVQGIYISNWEKHQNIDGLAKIREQAAKRVAKHRGIQKQLMLPSNVTVTQSNVTSNVTVTQGNAIDIELDIELDIDKDINNINIINAEKTKNFKKPTIEEIQSYCSERKNNVDPERFFYFYEAKGWMLGKNRMKNWQAAVNTWEQNDKNTSKPVIPVIVDEVDYAKLSR